MENFDSIIESSVEKQQPQRLSTEEWVAKKQEERAKLYDMAADMADKVFADPQNLKKYLDVQSRLGKASVNNALLAAAQKPEASYLLSYEDWQEKGRAVKRGEKAVMQLVANGEYERQDGSMGVSMDVKRMFDISQTHGKPIGQRAILTMPVKSKLKALTHNTPVPIRISDHVPQNAMYDAQEKEIRVARGLDGNTLVYSIARELAHAEFDRNAPDDYEHHLYEFEANCAAYITCTRLGLDVPLPSEIPYDLPERNTNYKKAVLNHVRDTACSIHERAEQNLYAERRQQKNMDEQTR